MANQLDEEKEKVRNKSAEIAELAKQWKSLEEELAATKIQVSQLTEKAPVPVIDVETGATSPVLPSEGNKRQREEEPAQNQSWMKGQMQTQGKLKQIKKEKSEADNRFGDRVLCVVCQDQERGVLTLPCSHVGLCGACAEEVAECPTCRTKILQRIQLKLL